MILLPTTLRTTYRRLCASTPLASRLLAHLRYLGYRYRYLIGFTIIGALSIFLELAIVLYVAPDSWLWLPKALLGFLFGLLFSFCLNVLVNFRVPRQYLLHTFKWFALVSVVSFSLNMVAVVTLREALGSEYILGRLCSSAILFFVAYTLHRRYSFDHVKYFGLALYATDLEDIASAFKRVGQQCDHIHVDLVDTTLRADALPVNLHRIEEIRCNWLFIPICLHLMTKTPLQWIERTWELVDWYLIHANADDDLMECISACRLRNKKVGIVWQCDVPVSQIIPLLPHIDFLMVLGVKTPGHSGQMVCEEALEAVQVFDRMRTKYKYELIFDGGITVHNVRQIPARHIVASSAVLHAQHPKHAVLRMKTGSRYEWR